MALFVSKHVVCMIGLRIHMSSWLVRIEVGYFVKQGTMILACQQRIKRSSFHRDFCYKAVHASSLLCFIACLFLLVRPISGPMLLKFTHNLAWVFSYPFS